jgi:hypothetical protein
MNHKKKLVFKDTPLQDATKYFGLNAYKTQYNSLFSHVLLTDSKSQILQVEWVLLNNILM